MTSPIQTALLCLLFPISTAVGNWPQFLGPDRDGTSSETVVSWGEAEPVTLWKKKIGAGFAGPVAASGTAILFHREGREEILAAFDLQSGRVKWRHTAPTSYRDDFGFDEGPRATPCIHDGRVYAIGAEGFIRCIDFASGRPIWTVDAKKQFALRKGFFGFAPSPIIEGDNFLVNLGGENGAGIVALDRKTGRLRWKATDDEAGYASPVAARLGTSGANQVLFFTREGLVVLEPSAGRVLLEFPWRARMHASVNAATPLVSSNLIFITASYDTGAALLRWKDNAVEKIWSGDESLSAHYATPVLRQGCLYGFHGRQELGPDFRCVDLRTGSVLWKEENFGAGTVTLAGQQLLILRESGELCLAPAAPDQFSIIARAQILGRGTRAYPALSGGHFLARDESSLVCLKLGPE